MNKLTIPRLTQVELEFAAEDGQTMAEYSVVLTLIIVVFGIAAFFVLATAIIGQFDRITGILG